MVRKANKFTQESLAEEAKLEISQISRIERGLINPTLSTLKVLADAMKISLKDLVDF